MNYVPGEIETRVDRIHRDEVELSTRMMRMGAENMEEGEKDGWHQVIKTNDLSSAIWWL